MSALHPVLQPSCEGNLSIKSCSHSARAFGYSCNILHESCGLISRKSSPVRVSETLNTLACNNLRPITNFKILLLIIFLIFKYCFSLSYNKRCASVKSLDSVRLARQQPSYYKQSGLLHQKMETCILIHFQLTH